MASQAELNLVVSLADKASKGLSGISKSVLGLGKSMTGLGKIAGGLSLGGAVAGLGVQIVKGIGDAREAAKVLAQTENVIKSTGGAANISAAQVSELASSLSAASGESLFGDDQIQQAENLLLTFTNVTNAVGEGNDIFNQATKAAVDMGQALGTDAASQAIALGKALNDPVKGVTALTRVGVSFTDQQKEQIKTMAEAGDTMGAQKVILAELNKEFGGSAQAAAAADGGWAQFQDRIGEIAEGVGARLLPALGRITTFLNSPEVQTAIEGFADMIATGLTVAVDWLESTGIPTFRSLYNTVAVLATGDFTGGIFGLSEDHPFILFLLKVHEIGATAFQIIKDGISGLATGDTSALKIDLDAAFGPDGGQSFLTVVQKIREGWGLARDALITFKDALLGNWKDADNIEPLHKAFGNLGLEAHGAGEWLVDTGLPNLKKAFDDSMPGNVQHVKDLNAALTGTKTAGKELEEVHLADILEEGFNPKQKNAQWLTDAARDFGTMGEQMNSILLPAIKRQKEDWVGLQSLVGSTLTTIGTKAYTTVQLVSNYFATFGGRLRTAVATDWGFIQGVVTRVGGAISGAMGTLSGVMSRAWASIGGAMRTAATTMAGVAASIQGAFATMGATIVAKVGEAIGVIASLPGRAAAAVGNLGKTLYQAGVDLVNGLKNGILDTAGSIATAAAGVVSRAVAAAKSAAGIRSPSKVMHDKVGKPLSEGIADGIRANEAKVSGAAKDVVKGAVDSGVNAAAETASKVAGAISSMIEALTKLQNYKGGLLLESTISGFTADVQAAITAVQSVAARMKIKALVAAAEFSEAATKVLSVISGGVDALLKLRDYEAGLLLESSIYGFTDDMKVVIEAIESVAVRMKIEAVQAAAEFSEAASKVLGVISGGVDALVKLRDYVAGGLLEATVHGFAADMKLVVEAIESVAARMELEGVQAAGEFSEAASKVLSILGPAIDGFTKLLDFKAIPEAALDALMDGIRLAVAKMQNIASWFDQEGTDAAALFADSAGRIIAPIADAVEAFTKLAEYKGFAGWILDMLGADIRSAVVKIEDLARQFSGPGVQAARDFGEAIGSMFSGLKTALDFMQQLAEGKGGGDIGGFLASLGAGLASIVVPSDELTGAVANGWMTIAQSIENAMLYANARITDVVGLMLVTIKNLMNTIDDLISKINNIPDIPGHSYPDNDPPPESDRHFLKKPSGSKKHRALGGPVMAGMEYMVGERGPEYFVPRTSGTIIPNNQLGDTVYNITIHAPSGDADAIGDTLMSALRSRGLR